MENGKQSTKAVEQLLLISNTYLLVPVHTDSIFLWAEVVSRCPLQQISTWYLLRIHNRAIFVSQEPYFGRLQDNPSPSGAPRWPYVANNNFFP